MAVVFFLTPLFLITISYFHPKSNSLLELDRNQKIKTDNGISFVVVAFAILIIYIKNTWIMETIPFLQDFVLTMLAGIRVGIWCKKNVTDQKKKKLNQQFHQLGTLGLYGFIITAIYSVFFIDLQMFSWTHFLFIILKTIFIAMITFVFVLLVFKKLSFFESMVSMVAGWTFILNAPVTCMHGMRTVVNKYGPVPDILLIIPPVILWLVNYLHLFFGLLILQ
jgi:sodium--glutamate symport carrier gltS